MEKFALGEEALGLTLLAGSIESVTALTMSGALIARLGSRLVASLAAIASCLILPLLILAPSLAPFVGCLVVFGICLGTMDVAMNAQAIGVEARYDRPIMSTFHALFSAGGLVGAAVG